MTFVSRESAVQSVRSNASKIQNAPTAQSSTDVRPLKIRSSFPWRWLIAGSVVGCALVLGIFFAVHMYALHFLQDFLS